MSQNHRNIFDATKPDPMPPTHQGKKRIIILAEPMAMLHGLAIATQDVLNSHELVVCQSLPVAAQDVAMVVVYGPGFANLVPTLQAARLQLPGVVLALLLDRITEPTDELRQVVERRMVDGILSLSQSFQVWTAAFNLLISGEEYMPSSVLRWSAAQPKPETALAPISTEHLLENGNVPGDLTPREQQVLGYLSHGFQNKIIAAHMRLSEHTVKIYVHNIIRKLKVHNRTQAANTYLIDQQRRMSPSLELRVRPVLPQLDELH